MAAPSLRVAWVGLGNMGSPLAGRVANYVAGQGGTMAVFDLAAQARSAFVAAHGGVAAASVAEACADASVVFLCLPTSAHSKTAALEADASLAAGATVVDVTSGDPEESKAIAAALGRSAYVDLAVSGGPAGAAAGTFAGKFVHLGGVGAGHAVKAVNNTLNSLHLAAAGEGLVALKKGCGVDPARALAAINAGSGKSLQTEVRLPKEVLTGDFDYGFAVALMKKDVGIGAALVRRHCAGAVALPSVEETLVGAVDRLGPDFDYTGIVKHIEENNGVDLRSAAE
ncbi:3-hydroxyisobutyrate dehydrogenase [Aureococcus anophagefferens]|nr:3-hydroxyisobutyrate dehydrogenase [Aureococcus anophagefferens]